MLTVDFHGSQSCDCCNYSVVDDTNYDDNPVSLFTTRVAIRTLSSGKQESYAFPFDDGNVLVIPQTKDFASIISLKLTPVTPIIGTVYFKDKYVISVCKSEQMARSKQKELLGACNYEKTLYQLMDIQSGINSALRLNRLGLVDEAQDVLTYLDRTYSSNCKCSCSE